jgi:hypothetical protein
MVYDRRRHRAGGGSWQPNWGDKGDRVDRGLFHWGVTPYGLAAALSRTPLLGLASPPDTGDIAPFGLTRVH